MSRQGKKDLNVDHNKFVKHIEQYVKEHHIFGAFVGHQGGSDLVAGEKKIVTLIKDNSSISTQDILDKAKELAENDNDVELEFETWRGQNLFPPLPCDPKTKLWDYEARRSYLRVMFNRLGFYKGSFKSIKEPSHCPPGFPAEKVSWRIFGQKGGPNGVKKKDADKIIQSFFNHYMPGTKMSQYYRGNVLVQEDGSDQSTNLIPTASPASAGAGAATPAAPGPSSRTAPLTSTPRIPSFSGTPTIIFKKGQVSQNEPEEGELDSSLEDTEENITYHDVSDKSDDEASEETEETEETTGEKEKKKKRKLLPIRLPTSSFILSEAEKRREKNIYREQLSVRQFNTFQRVKGGNI